MGILATGQDAQEVQNPASGGQGGVEKRAKNGSKIAPIPPVCHTGRIGPQKGVAASQEKAPRGAQEAVTNGLAVAQRGTAASVTERSREVLGCGPEGTDKKTTASKKAAVEEEKGEKVGTLGSSTAPAGSQKKKKKKNKKGKKRGAR